ncbi:hypothetical protein EDD21DRAFT_191456, partial [Dissophora ornata]
MAQQDVNHGNAIAHQTLQTISSSMQNIPGLSFFDGLTRSRTANQGRTSSSTLPTETPLRDAASLRSGRGSDPLTHPFGTNADDRDGEQGETVDAFEDPLSPSVSNTSSSPSTLPVASFSRRAATVSSGSSPIPGQSSRRATSSSTMGRSSILSKDSIFSTPILGRRPSSIADNSTVQSARERSGSTASSKENEEPTAKDVTLMAQGTQAYQMLKRIQEHPIELADIIRMLVTKKGVSVFCRLFSLSQHVRHRQKSQHRPGRLLRTTSSSQRAIMAN